MHALICSERSNDETFVRIVWFSIFVKFSTFVAMSASLRDSSSIIARYSSFCGSVSPPRLKSFANPAIDTMGVLNS